MNDVEKAVSQFKKGHNCCQSIFSTYSTRYGISEEMALKIACPFGGGMSRLGDTCGAVTGAFMIIGLKHGRIDPEDEESKEETYRLVNTFVEKFKARNKTIVCRELLGFNISNPQEHEKAEDEGLFETLCPKLVQDAAEILEEML
jgi:C_GCAxxG_C_C family probable redox protein